MQSQLLYLNTLHLPTPRNTRKLQLSSLHPPPPFTSSDKEPHSTQLKKIPPMVLRFPLKVLSAKRNMRLTTKVTSFLIPAEIRCVTEMTEVHHLTEETRRMNMMSELRGSVSLQTCSDTAKFLESSMEAEPLPQLDVFPPATRQLGSLLIIPDRHTVQALLNGQLCPAITTQQDYLMCWRRTSAAGQVHLKSAAPVVIDALRKVDNICFPLS
jgi:hypothetical protein